jgi:hypothetical protein
MDLTGKLQLKPGSGIDVVGAPTDLDLELPAGGDGLLVFASDSGELADAAARLVESAAGDALTWVAYPKAGKLGTDLNRDIVRETLEPRGARTVRQIAIDETWSALRLR